MQYLHDSRKLLASDLLPRLLIQMQSQQGLEDFRTRPQVILSRALR